MNDASVSSGIQPAATILLLRDDPVFQVLMVERHQQIEFASGALVFPGGKSHAGDYDERWADHALGWDVCEPGQRALRIAAIREVFEEAGILLARRGDGAAIGDAACSVEVRQAVDSGRLAFLQVVRELDARIDLEALTVFARWITPPLTSRRFDTWFYAVKAPEDQLAACDGRETVDAEWIAPGEALRLAAAGERKVVFPTRMNLQLLSEAQSAAEAVARASSRRLVTVQPQIRDGASGRVLVLPPDAGYGAVEEPLERVL